MNRKYKISLSSINYGPKDPEIDELTAMTFAHELLNKGYRRTSNAYCLVSRIDRNDWLQVLARALNCSVADFYKLDGTGVADNWKDHYIRVFSKDNLTVHPQILQKMKSY